MHKRKHSLSTKRKMRIAKLKNPTRYWLGKKRVNFLGEKNPFWRGGMPTCKTCKKTLSSYTAKHCRKCVRPTREHIRKVLKRREMSSLEKRIDLVIKKYNFPFLFVGNGKFFIERKNPDFVNNNGKKIAIEVYARRHKEALRNISINDWREERQKIFNKYGWQIIFIEDWQTNNEDFLVKLLKGGV